MCISQCINVTKTPLKESKNLVRVQLRPKPPQLSPTDLKILLFIEQYRTILP